MVKLATENPDGTAGWIIVNHVRAWVWMDDKIVRRCIAADDRKGEVWVHAADENGNIRIDRDRNEAVKEKLTGGKVEIRILNSKFERNQ